MNGYVRCSGGAIGDAAVMMAAPSAAPATGPAGTVIYTCMGRMGVTSSGFESSPKRDLKITWVPPTKRAGLGGRVDES